VTAALLFLADGYVLEGNQLMGRRAAGSAFLRAMVEGRGSDPLIAYASSKADADRFAAIVQAIDPQAPAPWIPADRLDLLARVGTLHRADPVLTGEARLRLRAGPAAYSLTGITHTLTSAGTLDAIAALLVEPVMPWDALICTSQAALAVVRSTLEAATEQLRWRTGLKGEPTLPQLPVIPLGVHTRDWTPDEAARAAARSRFGLGEDEVALLFAGRLSLAGKAHPFQMYAALAEVAAKAGRPIALLLAGQFFNPSIEAEYRAAAARICPMVRLVHVDGADSAGYAEAWSAADIFVSLADSLQETFGITPVEAMAAGLPSVVSDWNGYRDTVRDGIDGFRIASWAPAPGASTRLGLTYEIDGDYDAHCARTSALVSIDMAALVDRLAALVADPELRHRMGVAARERALADYDWGVIHGRYRALWAELAGIRRAGQRDTGWLAAAPRVHHSHDDPFARFAAWPSAAVTAETVVRAAPGADRAAYEALVATPLFAYWATAPDHAERVLLAAATPLTVAELAAALGRDTVATIEHVARLAKMNLLLLG
jgi:alpha-maltose-1-phosphate synthase